MALLLCIARGESGCYEAHRREEVILCVEMTIGTKQADPPREKLKGVSTQLVGRGVY